MCYHGADLTLQKSGRYPTMLLFVYGTLMRGERNRGDLEVVGAVFQGVHKTEAGFRMYHHPGDFPAVVAGGDGRIVSGKLWGEVWAVSGEGFEYLDSRERFCDDTGAPTGLERMEIQTPYGPAQMYALPTPPEGENMTQITSGDWRKR